MCHLFFTTTAVAGGRGRVFTAVCLSVFPDDISNTDAARQPAHLKKQYLKYTQKYSRCYLPTVSSMTNIFSSINTVFKLVEKCRQSDVTSAAMFMTTSCH